MPISKRTFGPRTTTRIAMAAALAVLAAAEPAAAVPTKVQGGIRFTYIDAYAQQVNWAGAFNGWNATASPMTKEGELWSVVIALPAGQHEYKFVVDGQWVADPENPVTAGEYGNSVVNIGADGNIVAAAATSNTPYSPKIFMGGRVIGNYQSIRNSARDRFELRRPDMDIDLTFDIRVSEVLKARFLTNIRSEAEDVEFFRSRLNFDRGHLDFTQRNLRIFAYDNDAVGTWDDPMHLVGDVGIYHHDYGFDRQGFRVASSLGGVDGELHYSDNFEPGSEFFPTLATDPVTDPLFAAELPVQGDPSSGYTLAPGGFTWRSAVELSDRNEDMLAARFQLRPMATLRLGALGRLDRGFNLGNLALLETTGPQMLRFIGGSFEEQWYAAGGEARWEPTAGFRIDAEYLRGVQRLSMVEAQHFDFEATAIDSNGVQAIALANTGGSSEETRTLDTSNRFELDGHWTAAHGDITVRAGFEYQDHAYQLELDGLENSLRTWTLGWDRNWRYYLNREVKTTLDIAWYDFDYDPSTPWNRQFWFAPTDIGDPTALSAGNFWLEHGEHLMTFDRLTLVGGADVVSIRPNVEIPIWVPRNLTFEFAGVYNATKLGRLPKYAESNFRFGIDLTRQIRLSTDTRWVKYDDQLLGLFDGYTDHFAQLAYAFAPGIRIELSVGVNPYEIDPATNEFDKVGRDQFLFDVNRYAANGQTADVNYFSLGDRIADAERALRDERRFQLRGVVHF